MLLLLIMLGAVMTGWLVFRHPVKRQHWDGQWRRVVDQWGPSLWEKVTRKRLVR